MLHTAEDRGRRTRCEQVAIERRNPLNPGSLVLACSSEGRYHETDDAISGNDAAASADGKVGGKEP